MGLKVLVSCTPIMITNVIPLITTAIPRTTIQRAMGTDMLGYFSTMFTPTVLITVIVPTVMQSRLPKLSEEWDRYDRRFRKELIFCYTAVLLIAGSWILSVYIYNENFNKRFESYEPLMLHPEDFNGLQRVRY